MLVVHPPFIATAAIHYRDVQYMLAAVAKQLIVVRVQKRRNALSGMCI